PQLHVELGLLQHWTGRPAREALDEVEELEAEVLGGLVGGAAEGRGTGDEIAVPRGGEREVCPEVRAEALRVLHLRAADAQPHLAAGVSATRHVAFERERAAVQAALDALGLDARAREAQGSVERVER